MSQCKFNDTWYEAQDMYVPFFIEGIEKGISLSQPILYISSSLLFTEDVYFNLMAGLRKLRLDIPMHVTEDFFESETVSVIQQNNWENSSVVLYWNVFASDEGLQWLIYGKELKGTSVLYQDSYTIDVYKDISISHSLLSAHRVYHPENYPAKVYAAENGLDDVIFLHPQRKIARTIQGNLYLIQGNEILTSNLEQGAYRQAIDKSFRYFLQKETECILQEQGLSPFLTQQSDEVFILSEDKGMISVKTIRNKDFPSTRTEELATKFLDFSVNL